LYPRNLRADPPHLRHPAQLPPHEPEVRPADEARVLVRPPRCESSASLPRCAQPLPPVAGSRHHLRCARRVQRLVSSARECPPSRGTSCPAAL
jgi:hypothetical protein